MSFEILDVIDAGSTFSVKVKDLETGHKRWISFKHTDTDWKEKIDKHLENFRKQKLNKKIDVKSFIGKKFEKKNDKIVEKTK